MLPQVPQSSRLESLGFPSYPLPLNSPPKNPTTEYKGTVLLYRDYNQPLYGSNQYKGMSAKGFESYGLEEPGGFLMTFTSALSYFHI